MSTFSPHDLTDFLPDNLLIKAKQEFPWADLFWSVWRIFTGGRGGIIRVANSLTLVGDQPLAQLDFGPGCAPNISLLDAIFLNSSKNSGITKSSHQACLRWRDDTVLQMDS